MCQKKVSKEVTEIKRYEKPDDCQKYDKCSAPICPLDPDMLTRTHLKGERVCFYLTEYVKPVGKAKLRGSLPRKFFEAIVNACPKIIARYRPIRNRLKEAKKRGSRLVNNPRNNVA